MHQARIEFPVTPVPVALPEAASSRTLAVRLAVAARPRRDFHCLECGAPFQSPEDRAEFCCTAHRKAWNNRRAIRGAQLYDLFMAMRFERGRAKLFKLWGLICALASAYRDADNALRAGRRSWRRTEAALAEIPQAYGQEGDGR